MSTKSNEPLNKNTFVLIKNSVLETVTFFMTYRGKYV